MIRSITGLPPFAARLPLQLPYQDSSKRTVFLSKEDGPFVFLIDKFRA